MEADGLAEYLERSLDELAAPPRGPQQVVTTIGRFSSEYPDQGNLTPAQATDLEKALRRVREVRTRYGPDDGCVVVELMLLGKLGRFGEAIAAGRRAYEDTPNWASAIALANALRRSGDLAGSIDMLWAASRHDLQDVTALLQAGDGELALGHWPKALAAYEAALARQARHPWALPSAHYCRLRITGDAQWAKALRKIAQWPRDECGVAGMLQHLVGGYTADDARARAEQLLEWAREAGAG